MIFTILYYRKLNFTIHIVILILKQFYNQSVYEEYKKMSIHFWYYRRAQINNNIAYEFR